MHVNWVIAIYLAVQGMISVAALEVAYRYGRWYSVTAKSEGLLLRSLILGIAITHVAILGDNLSWTFERLTKAAAMDKMYEQMYYTYLRLDFFRCLLYIGIVVHLVPVWKIVHRYTWGEVGMAILIRAALALALYAAVLYYAGLLGCYLIVEKVCM